MLNSSLLRCGIVALCMALKHLNKECTVEQLMTKAKELNFTKSGEMFDGKPILLDLI